jgi:tRNA/tmRNA/rRNA uracil-C5-methylase (TrmA/RlmC/RlmD family)
VIGVDMTAEMVKKATDNAVAAAVPNVEFHRGEADRLPAGEPSIRVITKLLVSTVCGFGHVSRRTCHGNRVN